MKTIAIMNNKGGVGKTVTAINLADILANDYKQRVVLVDCDGQANLTNFYLPGIEVDTPTTGDILTGDCEQVWSDNLIPLRHNIQLLPSSSGLYDLDLQAIKDGFLGCMPIVLTSSIFLLIATLPGVVGVTLPQPLID